MELKKITTKNVWQIIKLGVSKSQAGFVESNEESIIEAFADREEGITALPYALYEGEELVGFVMLGYGSTGDKDDPDIAADSYCIREFMIDLEHQGHGLGKKALCAIIDYIRTFPCGPATRVWLSYEPHNAVARSLYFGVGFRENGETFEGETVAVMNL